eukprot:TRINITY_DN111268_c0_g1_i1.p1 TRINITY_DN111268_c0_g1~~TRINITY_DN111268_c0_g1_i1.p1  ORF type:complete len:299 (+),score=71.11 TRINITY_DN111268_c0_g1_i1:125-1021(+)
MAEYKTFDSESCNFDDQAFKRKTIKVDPAAVSAAVLGPWMVYCMVFGLFSFYVNFNAPHLAWAGALACLGAAGVSVILGNHAEAGNNDPTWYRFFARSTVLAVIAGLVCGNLNFAVYMQPAYFQDGLLRYDNVDPKSEFGQRMMDAGFIYFNEKTSLDMRKAMGFRDRQTYCVAPISSAGNKENLDNYDFWAVGKDCCSGVSADFRCGEYMNEKARAGIRLLSEEDRPYYHLAVEQAMAAYGIRAAHPIFLEWTEDPVMDVGAWRGKGVKMYILGVMTYFSINFALVAIAMVGLGSKR